MILSWAHLVHCGDKLQTTKGGSTVVKSPDPVCVLSALASHLASDGVLSLSAHPRLAGLCLPPTSSPEGWGFKGMLHV